MVDELKRLGKKEETFLSDVEASLVETAESQEIKKYETEEISPGSFFTKPVFLEKQFILATPEMPVTKDIIKALSDWEFSEIYSTGYPKEEYTAIIEKEVEEKEVPELTVPGDSEKIKRAEEFYTTFVRDMQFIFAQATVNNPVNFDSIAEKIKTACIKGIMIAEKAQRENLSRDELLKGRTLGEVYAKYGAL